MRAKAIAAAQVRLERARGAEAQLSKRLLNFANMADQWAAFLVAANGVFAMLEQGAKGHIDSEKWFALRRGERRVDAMLQYVRQARHADEHGIDPITRNADWQMEAKSPNTSITYDAEGKATVHAVQHAPFEMLVTLPRLMLVEVRNRGVSYEVPAEFFGNPIPSAEPYIVANVVLQYLEWMCKDAETLATH